MKTDHLLRVILSDYQDALDDVGELPPSDYDRVLGVFRHHTREAMNSLREYAKANGIEL